MMSLRQYHRPCTSRGLQGHADCLLFSTQACMNQLPQPFRHHLCEISRVRYAVCLSQGRSQFLVESDDDEGGLEHGVSLHRTQGRL